MQIEYFEMNYTELKNSLQLFREALQNRRMTQALAALESYLSMTKSPWELHRRLEELKNQYQLMVNYALKGSVDPERPKLYARISSEANAIAEAATRISHALDRNTLYYSTLRYESSQTGDSISSLLDSYRDMVGRRNLVMMSGNLSAGSVHRSAMEALERRIFNRVWTTYPLSQQDESALGEILSSSVLPVYFRRLICSAIMLGGLETFDERRLMLLGRPYASGDSDLEMQALCGLLLVMWANKDRLDGLRHFPAMAATLSEMPKWNEDVKTIFLEFIRTRDTEKITRSIREDLTPSIMKLRPGLKNLSGDVNDQKSIDEILDPEANPEWMDMIENSGLGEKLRKMSEMQQEGADVMLSSFGNLKTFPFFNDIANWFMPFHADHSAVAEVMNQSGSLLNMLLGSSALCDSDKYSMVLSISSLPATQRRMLENQLSAQEEMMKGESTGMIFADIISREKFVNKYVQDLYRFFHLFRRKGEFTNPFTAPVNLVEVKSLEKVFDDADSLSFFGDFYFKHGYYPEAASMYERLVNYHAPDALLYQKLGYSYHQTGLLENALTWYERSELIDSANQWTLKRIAQIYKAKSRFDKAAEYYRRLDLLKPDDISHLMNLGGCLLAMDKPQEALKVYFKVEFLEGENPKKSVRPLAWSLYLTGDFARSRKYYDKMFESGKIQPSDYLNRGHLNLVMHNVSEAIEDYTTYLKLTGYDTDKFEEELKNDRGSLERHGVEPLLIDIVADKTIY